MESIRTLYKIGRGPSSSHTIGPDLAIRQFLSENDVDHVEVYLYGSIAFTGKGHLTDQVIINALEEKNIEYKINFDFKTLDEDLNHPNTMKFVGSKEGIIIDTWTVYSVGGGNIEIEGRQKVHVQNDCYIHNSLNDIKIYCIENNLTLLDYINKFDTNLDDYLNVILDAMFASVERGLGTDGVIQGELKLNRRASTLFNSADGDKDLLLCAYAYAVSEENATGGEIVTAPTCGACGVLPATLYYYSKQKQKSRDLLIDALKIAGLFGCLVRENASISGAEAGCQAEIGTATSMSAAAIMMLKVINPSIQQLESAAEIGLEHSLGLTCDPILGYVQIPCIQRNAVSALKAKSAAKIAQLSADMEIVDFDTITKVMYETGKDMHSGYRETSQLGLAKYFKTKE